jgi:hypothetical protein
MAATSIGAAAYVPSGIKAVDAEAVAIEVAEAVAAGGADASVVGARLAGGAVVLAGAGEQAARALASAAMALRARVSRDRVDIGLPLRPRDIRGRVTQSNSLGCS